jgi:dolichol-phosphate mannosyltransferase
MKSLVILPTYNEKENISTVIDMVLEHGVFDILIVDDNSSDGTREIAINRAEMETKVNLIKRPEKMGLGTAYITGFKWGIERGYGCLIEMDSDLSHDPHELPKFAAGVEGGADLVIGSRYIGGRISVVGWDFKRLLLSRFGNIYASFLLNTPLKDMTSGFRGFSRKALESIELDEISSEGYAFQIEMAYYVWKSGMLVKEIPIVFTERAKGSSKMSKEIVREAIWLPWRLIAKRMASSAKRSLGIRKKSRTNKEM